LSCAAHTPVILVPELTELKPVRFSSTEAVPAGEKVNEQEVAGEAPAESFEQEHSGK